MDLQKGAIWMNFIRRLNRKDIYLSCQRFQSWGLISGMKVIIKYKISAQFL